MFQHKIFTKLMRNIFFLILNNIILYSFDSILNLKQVNISYNKQDYIV